MNKKRIKLSSSTETRQAISKVANMVLNGEITPAQGNTIIYAANISLQALKAEEIEKRIEELEQSIQRKD